LPNSWDIENQPVEDAKRIYGAATLGRGKGVKGGTLKVTYLKET